MKTLKLARIAAATIALAVGGAHAAPLITSWDVIDIATFDPATVVPSSGVAPDPVLSIDKLKLRWGTAASVTGQSGLDIKNFSPVTIGLGVATTTVSVTHLNHPIFVPALKSVDIFASLKLTPTGAPPPPVIDDSIVFKVKFFETTNQPGTGVLCPDGTANNIGININGCADIFVITNEDAAFSFVIPADTATYGPGDQAYQYSVNFFGTGFTPLSNAACLSAGASSGCSGFLTAEDQDTTAFFQVRIDASPIPEPGSLALLGLGLLGLGAARRRMSAK